MKTKLSNVVICAVLVMVMAGGLFAINQVTAPIIADQAGGQSLKQVQTYLSKYYPGGKYSEVTFADSTGLVTGAYKADGKGLAYKVETTGFNKGTKIVFIVGYDLTGKIVGFDVISQAESVGYGATIAEDTFKNSIIGKTSTDSYTGILVSGATHTSTAVQNGLNAAKALFNAAQSITDPNANEKPTVPDSSLVIAQATGTGVLDEAASSIAGDLATYVVRADGYGAKNHGDNPNKFTIVINLATKTIESVEVTVFNDTEEVGDKIERPTFLAQFKGLSIIDDGIKVDAASGATESSKSAVAAVKVAVEAARKKLGV